MPEIIKIPIIRNWTIILEFLQTDLKTMARYQHYFQQLIEANVFETRNGKVILNFDGDNNLREIEFQVKKRYNT